MEEGLDGLAVEDDGLEMVLDGILGSELVGWLAAELLGELPPLWLRLSSMASRTPTRITRVPTVLTAIKIKHLFLQNGFFKSSVMAGVYGGGSGTSVHSFPNSASFFLLSSGTIASALAFFPERSSSEP